MSQKTKVIWLWEAVLSQYAFKRIIELGTWKGGLALFFHLFALARKAEFYTYDNRVIWRNDFKVSMGLGEHFYQKDIFQNVEEIGKIIASPGITILFCDNGNKPREFQTFVPFLKKDDIIAVHDWKAEIFPADVEKGCEQYKLEEIFKAQCDEEGLTRFFQKYA